MKRKLISFLLLVLIGGLLASCDEDNGLQLDDPEVPENATSQSVASIYHGQLVRIIEQQAGSGVNNVTDEAITNNISVIGDEKSSMVTLKFQNLRLKGEKAVAEWEIPDISLFKDGNVYYLNGEARDIALWETKDGRIARVYVSGTVESDSLHVTVDIKTPGFQGAYAENMNLKFDGKGGHTIGNAAEITSFELETNPVINKVTLNQDKKEIVILVNKDVADNELRFNANVVSSEGASLTVGSFDFTGDLDFTEGKTLSTIKVVSEDGLVTNSYKVYCIKLMDLNYMFDSWSWDNNFKFDFVDGWTSNNEDFAYLRAYGMYNGENPVQKGNNYAVIKTIDINGLSIYGPVYKKAMAGYFYLGGLWDQNTSASGKFAESNKLGTLYKSQPKPLKFSGKYSYTAGSTVYDTDAQEVTGVTDECLLGFYLYEVAKESETLDAVSIHTSDKVVAKAEVISGNTAGEQPFEIDIQYNDGYIYDSSKTYKLVILLTSSKDGHFYQGAPGSTLTVSEVSVVTE